MGDGLDGRKLVAYLSSDTPTPTLDHHKDHRLVDLARRSRFAALAIGLTRMTSFEHNFVDSDHFGGSQEKKSGCRVVSKKVS